jgi:hypothetical protein
LPLGRGWIQATPHRGIASKGRGKRNFVSLVLPVERRLRLIVFLIPLVTVRLVKFALGALFAEPLPR